MIRAFVLPSIAVLALAACGQPDEPAEAPAPEAPPATESPAQTDSNALSAQGWGPLRIEEMLGDQALYAGDGMILS